jgi:hypothetical protein
VNERYLALSLDTSDVVVRGTYCTKRQTRITLAKSIIVWNRAISPVSTGSRVCAHIAIPQNSQNTASGHDEHCPKTLNDHIRQIVKCGHAHPSNENEQRHHERRNLLNKRRDVSNHGQLHMWNGKPTMALPREIAMVSSILSFAAIQTLVTCSAAFAWILICA